jgi:hypothetical protein
MAIMVTTRQRASFSIIPPNWNGRVVAAKELIKYHGAYEKDDHHTRRRNEALSALRNLFHVKERL